MNEYNALDIALDALATGTRLEPKFINHVNQIHQLQERLHEVRRERDSIRLSLGESHRQLVEAREQAEEVRDACDPHTRFPWEPDYHDWLTENEAMEANARRNDDAYDLAKEQEIIDNMP